MCIYEQLFSHRLLFKYEGKKADLYVKINITIQLPGSLEQQCREMMEGSTLLCLLCTWKKNMDFFFFMVAHQPDSQLIKYVGHICCQLNTWVEQWGSVESVWLSPAPEICGNMLSLGCAEETRSGTHAAAESCEDKHSGGELSWS